MPLTSGTRLGAYEVTGALGAGGMGEVYRARDTALNREVAIKVLPEAFALDADRLARFTREAQTLAALNHPNIAQVYGLESVQPGGRAGRALVMELVRGEDLSALIARGPVPLDDALSIARQIADALEAAHEQGIVHRDLKPANVKVRPDGTVKVLDFGLAKALAPEGVTATSDAMQSPTLTARGTQMGMIIGTAAYMAPEQARGKAVDRRADIWAFGVVLYEMLTGRRAFAGTETSDVLASVLKSDPDWSAVPVDTPDSVRRLLRRCLEKEPRKRLSAIGDARLELDEMAVPPPAGSQTPAAASASVVGRIWPALAAVLLTVLGAALLWPRVPSTGVERVTRLSVLAPPGTQLYPESSSIALSPDGTMIAFIVANVTLSETQLWVRSLDSMQPRRLEGTEGAALPFWSPDSSRIGFFTIGKLKAISPSGGRAEVLCDVKDPRGAAWGASNVIVFAPDASGGLYQIPATGGTPTPATTLDAGSEYGHRFPTFLPDGRHFLYAALPGKGGRFNIFAGSLDDSSRTLVGTLGSAPVYAEPGWLLYSRQGTLAAQRFDPRTRQIVGEPVLLPDEPSSILDPATAFTGGLAASASLTGALAYFSVPSNRTTTTWYDAAGRTIGPLALPPAHYEAPSISPDGRHAAIVRSVSPTESSLWLVDLVRGSVSPLSTSAGRNDSPVWSPDGTRVVFASDRDGPQDLFVKRIGDASPDQPVHRSDVLFKRPTSWSPGGEWITVTQLDAETAQNIWLVPLTAGTAEPKVLVRTPGRDVGGPISPDGRWLAFTSEETGRYELWLQSFPEPGRRTQVSQEGASRAWWRPDGRQLLYLDNDMERLWRVDVEAGATLRIGAPRLIATFPPNIIWMDATPDRERFLAIAPERTGAGSITVVENWLTGHAPVR